MEKPAMTLLSFFGRRGGRGDGGKRQNLDRAVTTRRYHT